MRNRKTKLFCLAYITAFVICVSLAQLNRVPWRDASVLEFAREFSNLIPGCGIMETLQRAMRSGILHLNPILIHLVAMLPLGLYLGLAGRNMDRREILFQCGKVSLMLAALYLARLFLKLGSFDVDDILLNTIGLILGMLLGQWGYLILSGRNNA